MKLPMRKSRKITDPTPETVISAALRQAYKIHPARVMPAAIISALNAAGFVIMSEVELDDEIALAYQAGEECGRER